MAKNFVQVVVTLCLVWWLSPTMVDADSLKYEDPRQPVFVRVKDLLGPMTLEEKISQMAQIDRSVANATVTKNSFIGSVLINQLAVELSHFQVLVLKSGLT